MPKKHVKIDSLRFMGVQNLGGGRFMMLIELQTSKNGVKTKAFGKKDFDEKIKTLYSRVDEAIQALYPDEIETTIESEEDEF